MAWHDAAAKKTSDIPAAEQLEEPRLVREVVYEKSTMSAFKRWSYCNGPRMTIEVLLFPTEIAREKGLSTNSTQAPAPLKVGGTSPILQASRKIGRSHRRGDLYQIWTRRM